MANISDCAAPHWLTAKSWDTDLFGKVDRLSVYERTKDVPPHLAGAVVVRAEYMCIEGVCDFSEALEIIESSETLAATRIMGVCHAVVSAIQSDPTNFCAENVAGVLVKTENKAFYLENKSEYQGGARGVRADRTIVIDAHALYRAIFQQRLEYTRQMERIHHHAYCGAIGVLLGATMSFFARK